MQLSLPWRMSRGKQWWPRGVMPKGFSPARAASVPRCIPSNRPRCDVAEREILHRADDDLAVHRDGPVLRLVHSENTAPGGLRIGVLMAAFCHAMTSWAAIFRRSGDIFSSSPRNLLKQITRGWSQLDSKCRKREMSVHGKRMSRIVIQDPEILGGEPVFAGTRVPARSLFDHLEAGDSIEDFLEGFPSVKREQVIALLEESKAHALAAA